MPYDIGAESQKSDAHRRGPLRPERLASVRSRIAGGALSHTIQLGDLLILAGVAFAAWRRSGAPLATPYLLVGSGLVAVMLVSFEVYRLNGRERLYHHLYRVVGSVGGSVLILLSVLSFAAPASRTDTLITTVNWGVSLAGLLCAAHLFWFSYVRRLRRQGLLTPNLVIVGATPAAERLIHAALGGRDVNIVGIFDDRGARSPRDLFGVPVLGKTADLMSHRLLPYIDRIVVTVPPGATARIAQLIETLGPIPNPVSLLVDGDGARGEHDALERVFNLPIRHLTGSGRGTIQPLIKRSLDIGLSLAAVIALLPLLAVVAIAIRLDSPGPILFKQRRHGFLNEEVLVWKFRSMRVDAADHSASRQVTANDDRVTRVGGFLRRTSLDELPQLWNVIRGEMSLVGPRPHAIGMMAGGAEASKLVATYAHRHRMKPGLTGWAAVNGSRGPVDTPEAVQRRVSLDLEYVDSQSVWLDLAIMLRTLPCMLGDTESVR